MFQIINYPWTKKVQNEIQTTLTQYFPLQQIFSGIISRELNHISKVLISSKKAKEQCFIGKIFNSKNNLNQQQA